jgi:hypothetical protein
MKSELRLYEPSYYLLEESRKSWDHVASDKLVYFLKPRKVACDSLTQIAKNYLEGRFWIESHLTFRGPRDTHYVSTYEFDMRSKGSRQMREAKIALISVDGNSSVLVDIAEQIETPKKMTLNGCGIPSVIRLKRFNDTNCI